MKDSSIERRKKLKRKMRQKLTKREIKESFEKRGMASGSNFLLTLLIISRVQQG